MKNHRIKTKLILNSQTIRRLSAAGLHVVQGGMPVPVTLDNCNTEGCTQQVCSVGCRDCN